MPTTTSAPAPTLASGTFVVTEGHVDPPVPYAVGSRLLLPRRGWVELSRDPLGPQGSVVSPDGRYVAYEAVPTGSIDPAHPYRERFDPPPVIRLLDLTTGSDGVVDEAAITPAWSGDGRLAYLKGGYKDTQLGPVFVGQVMVREGPTGESQQWSAEPVTGGLYGWAGSGVLVLSFGIDSGSVSVVERGQAPRLVVGDTFIVAISPDGARLAVLGGVNRATFLRIVSVSDGHELFRGELPKDPATGEQVHVGASGSWQGDRIIASGLAFRARPTPGPRDFAPRDVVVYDVRGGAGMLIDVRGFGDPIDGVGDPRYLPGTVERFVALAAVHDSQALLECDLPSRSCLYTRLAPSSTRVRVADNRSRPLSQ